MGAPSVFQIMKSNAVLWYGPIGEAFPDETTVHAGELWGGNWERLGSTKEPLTFLYEDERADVNVEEFLSPVHRFKTSEALSIETVLAEIDADYMALMTEGGVAKTACLLYTSDAADEVAGYSKGVAESVYKRALHD